jgi:hypothetical protein
VKVKYGICSFILLAASFLITSRLYPADQAAVPEHQKTPDAGKNSRPASEILMPYCFVSSAQNPNTMPEMELRNYVVKCTKILLAGKDYKSLDAMINFLRDNKVRTSSGLWLQSFYYGDIQEFIEQAGTQAEFDAIETELNRWRKTSKNSDASRLATATLMSKRAWQYRGSGYASSVSEEAFKNFHVHIEMTRKYLFENEDISKRDPEWFSETFNVLRVGSYVDEEQYQQYFNKAVSQFPEYYPMYFSAASFYLSKWHGDDAAFDMFAKSGTGILSPEQAKALYARIYWAQACGRCGDVRTWRDHWSDIRAGFEQIIKDYPDEWNINNYARIACSAYDKDKTLELMQKIKNKPLADAWNDEIFNYEYCASWSGFSKADEDVE